MVGTEEKPGLEGLIIQMVSYLTLSQPLIRLRLGIQNSKTSKFSLPEWSETLSPTALAARKGGSERN